MQGRILLSGVVSAGRVAAAVLAVGLTLAGAATEAKAQCTIQSSACYPWRIDAGEAATVLLEIVPNNATTGVIYRVCLCPPARKVSVVFDFEAKKVEIGAVETKSGSAICRDFRIATARKSRLLLARPAGAEGALDGCYVTQ